MSFHRTITIIFVLYAARLQSKMFLKVDTVVTVLCSLLLSILQKYDKNNIVFVVLYYHPKTTLESSSFLSSPPPPAKNPLVAIPPPPPNEAAPSATHLRHDKTAG